MRSFSLDGRLSSVGKFVRQGAVFADIGTDHGYLPLYLLENGIIERAILSDINQGPLSSAKENAVASGLADKCSFYLSDGGKGLSGLGITDVAIAGMGGELIADIIENAPHFRDTGIRLILQPMSRQAELRRYLAGAGFRINEEDYSYSAGKYYVTIVASFSGESHSLSEAEEHFGEACHLTPLNDVKLGYLLSKKRALEKARRGKSEGGEDTHTEEALLDYINQLIDNNGGAV